MKNMVGKLKKIDGAEWVRTDQLSTYYHASDVMTHFGQGNLFPQNKRMAVVYPGSAPQIQGIVNLARKHGAKTALDIDYRPNLWGVAGHGAGESRFVESAKVTAKLQSTLHLFDLIVGTEEEFHSAGGSTDTVAALRAVRRQPLRHAPTRPPCQRTSG